MTESLLWNRIRQCGKTTFAVMGMTKNAGKTVALNHLLAQAAASHVDVGVSSIGRDGEDRDQVFFTPKPPVMVWPGSLVATARASLQRSKARCKVIAGTGIECPLGEILLVKPLEHGAMEIAGPSRGADQIKLIGQLKQSGCALVLLDGALGRSHHASPAIADGVILATGAALGGCMTEVIRKTRDRLAILGIPQADAETRERCAPVFAKGGVGLWNWRGEVLVHAEIPTINAADTLLRFLDHEVATVALCGAVGRALWQAIRTLESRHPGLTVVVADGTRLFIEPADLALFRKHGARLVGFRAIRIAGIALNPSSATSAGFPAADFLNTAREAFAGYAVSDVLWEEGRIAKGER